MIKLELRNALAVINLNEQYEVGTGIQAVAGATGFGLPQRSLQWLEGAGDGSIYQGRRILSRDINLPLDVVGRDRVHLKKILSRLALMLAGPCTLTHIDEDGSRWSADVVLVGGGDFAYGEGSTGERDWQTTITLRAPSSYFTSEDVTSKSIGGDTTTGSFLSSMVSLPVASSQAIGSIDLENVGDADAYPVWEIHGPGHDFEAIAPLRDGQKTPESIRWEGTLADGEVLIIDTRTGLVVDQAGANRYADLAPAPRFWSIAPGRSVATASLIGVSPTSKIVCSWRPRKWMVI
ncbi:phage tail family protein [Kitasatospora sp. NPDC048540]|uniref:phage tail family protein n=1 Tax=Kitasatospora sp. NPDC048540 TaxID=3155634 RepID=UPI003400AA49